MAQFVRLSLRSRHEGDRASQGLRRSRAPPHRHRSTARGKQMIYEPSFNDAVNFTLRAEGLLSNNPNDKGGLTKFGVTQARWAQYRAKFPTLPQSVSNITVDQAVE